MRKTGRKQSELTMILRVSPDTCYQEARLNMKWNHCHANGSIAGEGGTKSEATLVFLHTAHKA